MIVPDNFEEGAFALSDEDLAFETRLRDAEESVRTLEQQGWVWRGDDGTTRILCHPDDPEITVWHNPYTGEQLFSPKLIERLKNDCGFGS
jgi:predicted RNA binding protein YcfA (HicA-like mRNA interferase family)